MQQQQLLEGIGAVRSQSTSSTAGASVAASGFAPQAAAAAAAPARGLLSAADVDATVDASAAQAGAAHATGTGSSSGRYQPRALLPEKKRGPAPTNVTIGRFTSWTLPPTGKVDVSLMDWYAQQDPPFKLDGRHITGLRDTPLFDVAYDTLYPDGQRPQFEYGIRRVSNPAGGNATLEVAPPGAAFHPGTLQGQLAVMPNHLPGAMAAGSVGRQILTAIADDWRLCMAALQRAYPDPSHDIHRQVAIGTVHKLLLEGSYAPGFIGGPHPLGHLDFQEYFSGCYGSTSSAGSGAAAQGSSTSSSTSISSSSAAGGSGGGSGSGGIGFGGRGFGGFQRQGLGQGRGRRGGVGMGPAAGRGGGYNAYGGAGQLRGGGNQAPQQGAYPAPSLDQMFMRKHPDFRRPVEDNPAGGWLNTVVPQGTPNYNRRFTYFCAYHGGRQDHSTDGCKNLMTLRNELGPALVIPGLGQSWAQVNGQR